MKLSRTLLIAVTSVTLLAAPANAIAENAVPDAETNTVASGAVATVSAESVTANSTAAEAVAAQPADSVPAPATTVPTTEVPTTEVPGTTVPNNVLPTADAAGLETTAADDNLGGLGNTLAALDAQVENAMEDPLIDAAACGTADCVMPMATGTGVAAGANYIPTGSRSYVRRGGGALPYTGIEDVAIALLIAAITVLGGYVFMRWAKVRELLSRNTRYRNAIEQHERSKSPYYEQKRRLQINERARKFLAAGSTT